MNRFRLILRDKIMKHNLWVLAAMVCMLLCVSTACDDSEGPVEPISSDDVKGNYDGIVTVGEDAADNISLTIGDEIVISNFPVDSIVKLAVPQEFYDEAVSSVSGNVNCTLGYSTDIFGLNIFLTLSPEPVEFSVAYNDESHEIVATLNTADKDGVYNVSDNSLSFKLQLDHLTVDGNDLPVKQSMAYEFELKKK